MAFQVFLGAGLVLAHSPDFLGALHLGLALAVLGLAAAASDRGFQPAMRKILSRNSPRFFPVKLSIKARLKFHGNRAENPDFPFSFARLSLAAALAVFLVLVSGAAVVASGAGQVCSGWPLCAAVCRAPRWAGLSLSPRMTGIAAVLDPAGLLAGLAVAAQPAGDPDRGYRRVHPVPGTGADRRSQGEQGFPTDLVGLHAASSAALWAVLAIWLTAVGLADRSVDG